MAKCGRCGTDRGSQVHGDPAEDAPRRAPRARRGGALLKVVEGPGESGGSQAVAGGYFWTGVFFFRRPVPFSSCRRAPGFVCLRTTYCVRRECSS